MKNAYKNILQYVWIFCFLDFNLWAQTKNLKSTLPIPPQQNSTGSMDDPGENIPWDPEQKLEYQAVNDYDGGSGQVTIYKFDEWKVPYAAGNVPTGTIMGKVMMVQRYGRKHYYGFEDKNNLVSAKEGFQGQDKLIWVNGSFLKVEK